MDIESIIMDEKYAHLFLDIAMKKLAVKLAKDRNLDMLPRFELDYVMSQGRLVEELEKLDLTDDEHYRIREFGPDIYMFKTSPFIF